MSSHILLDEINHDFIDGQDIVEIGSAREGDGKTSSTLYFSNLAKRKEIHFFSVDFSKHSYELAHKIVGDSAVHMDGAEFLAQYKTFSNSKIACLYLDNFDVIYSEAHKISLLGRVGDAYALRDEEISNERSAQVHLGQLNAALKHLAPKHVIIVDDTKECEFNWWGKGALVVPQLLSMGYEIRNRSNDGILLANF